MKAEEIEKIIRFLGHSRIDLLAGGVIPDEPLLQIFPGSENLYFEPEDGVEMTFSPEGEVFMKLFFMLKETTPSTLEYEGLLPGKLRKDMSQDWVRETFGAPKENHGPVRLPHPIGWTGGWDIYDFNGSQFPEVELVFKYTSEMKVETLVFKKKI